LKLLQQQNKLNKNVYNLYCVANHDIHTHSTAIDVFNSTFFTQGTEAALKHEIIYHHVYIMLYLYVIIHEYILYKAMPCK